MSKNDAKNRIEKLKQVINRHRYLYHVLDKQELSDSAFDSLKHELYTLEQQYPEFITPDSPTQRVGGEPLDKFEKIEHRTPMLSIEDVFNREELERWQVYLKRLEPSAKLEYFCELKIDGFAIALIYENGILKYGATRGDGKIGEDVTQNIKTLESIPLKLQIHQEIKNKQITDGLKQLINKGRIEIRGEVFMDKHSFEKINKERAKTSLSPFANPRNLAAGSIRQLDSKLAASRNLKFLAYDIPSDTSSDIGITTHSEKHKLISAIGFKAEKGKICQNIGQIMDFWKQCVKKREQLPYQVDGIVITVNDNMFFNNLGRAGKSPRGVRALKFAAREAVAKIKEIKLQVGRTGAVTPVAVLEPITIGGALISRATLHNAEEMERLGVKINDTVIIERAGDVIPAVKNVLKDLRTGDEINFFFPKNCPVCRTKLIKPAQEAIWRCPNVNCPARKSEFLEHFVSKKAFNIEGMGPKIIKQLVDEKLIARPSDIFELKQGDLLPLERFAQKSAENLIQAIEKSKQISLSRFIFALGIRYIGEETAIDLAETFLTIENLKKAGADDLQKIPDVGEKMAQSIYQWFRKKQNIELIEKLNNTGVKIQPPTAVGVDPRVDPNDPRVDPAIIRQSPISGKTFVFTGQLETITRDEAKQKIRQLSGRISGSVSAKTDYVIAGKNPGSKLQNAKKLGVKTINEKQFLNIITS